MTDLFLYSENIRKLIYTTNAIESVNSCLRKVTNGKGCFINQTALEKVLYDFGIAAKVVEIHIGPAVTQYELTVPTGTKVSKLLNLNNGS